MERKGGPTSGIKMCLWAQGRGSAYIIGVSYVSQKEAGMISKYVHVSLCMHLCAFETAFSINSFLGQFLI